MKINKNVQRVINVLALSCVGGPVFVVHGVVTCCALVVVGWILIEVAYGIDCLREDTERERARKLKRAMKKGEERLRDASN